MWLIVPSTCCPSAPEPGDSTSASEWRSQLLASSVAWNTKQRPASSWLRGWRTDALTRRLFGLIYEPSTASRGVESFIASLVASRVSRGPSQGSARELTTPGTSGPTPSASSESADLSGSSSKTWGASFGMDTSELFAPTLKALATGLRRRSSRQRTLARPTDASGSSSWPTAQAGSPGEKPTNNVPDNSPLHRAAAMWPTATGVMAKGGAYTYDNNDKTKPRLSLTGEAQMWPTARQEDAESAGNHPQAQDSLTGVAGLWSTPRSSDTNGAGSHGDGGIDLRTQIETLNWPTPQASEMPNTNANQKNMPPSLHGAAEAWQTPKSPDGGNTSRGHDRKGEPLLDGQARSWGPPTSRDWKDGDVTESDVPTNGLLGRQASRSFPPHPTTSQDGSASSESAPTSRRRLNPMFVEWLMGWIPGWTSLVPLGSGSPGTAWCRYRRRMLGAFCALDSRAE